MAWRRPNRVRDRVRLINKKRWRRHKTLDQLKPIAGDLSRSPLDRSRPAKVVRMFENLTKSGWKFSFKVQATSPHGFPYSADGATPIEAFLKAFGQWQKDVVSSLR